MSDTLHAPWQADGGPWVAEPAIPLRHETGPYGQLAREWEPGPPVWGQVPGGEHGERVLLVRDGFVPHALAHRDLAAIPRGHSLAGVGLQHDDGLLRRADGGYRDPVNHLWTQEQAEMWRPVIALTAARCAKALAGAGSADLVADFCRPYADDIIGTLGGLGGNDKGRQQQGAALRELSDATTGALLTSPAAHDPAGRAWGDLSEFLAPHIAAGRAGRQEGVMAATVGAWDDAGLTREQSHHAALCAWNGIPTVVPALARVIEQVLTRPGALGTVRADPSMAGPLVKAAMFHAAHFTFALPGLLTSPMYRDGRLLADTGCPVLPVIHAAHMARGRPWVLGGSAGLAWGLGVHECLGRYVAHITITEAVRELAALPRLELREIPERWPAALMPSPPSISVIA